MNSDASLVLRARGGDKFAEHQLIERYRKFVRLRAHSYFLKGAEHQDLEQEGLFGLYKAIRDYRTDRESSFRNFAELCITRQIITAVKTATRRKHAVLSDAVSLQKNVIGGADIEDTTLGELLEDPKAVDPYDTLEARGRLASLLSVVSYRLTELERKALTGLYFEGLSYERLARAEGVGIKQIDNAVQRAKRKLLSELEQDEDEVLAA